VTITWNELFFPVVGIRGAGHPELHLGTAFGVAPTGHLLTCRHVVDVAAGLELGIFDHRTQALVRIERRRILFPAHPEGLDLAILPPLPGGSPTGFPFLTPKLLNTGEDVFTFGFYSPSGLAEHRKMGYFKGALTSVDGTEPLPSLTLPFPVVEGLSGAPVLVQHYGVKAVGVCHGSEAQRVLASEVVDYRDDRGEVRETVHRVIEFGLAYHGIVAARFLRAAGVNAIMTDQRVALPGLEG